MKTFSVLFRKGEIKRLIKLKLMSTSNNIFNSEQTTISRFLLTTIAQSFSPVASELQAHNSKIFVLLLRAKTFVLGLEITNTTIQFIQVLCCPT